MPVNSVLAPYPTFFDATGAPLENGFIYIGEAGFEARSTPKASFFDEALTIPTGTASGSAVRTSGGVPVNQSGAPAMFYVDGEYSISVCDRNGVLLYSALTPTLVLNAGGAVGPVLWADGSLGAVGGGFVNEPNTGFVRPSANTMQTVIGGVLVSTQTVGGTVFAQPVSGAGFDTGVLAVAEAKDADLTAIAALSGTGIAVRTAGNTWAQRQVTSTDGSIIVTNPAGIGGNINLSTGGPVLLASKTAAASATLDFTEFNNALYSRYLFLVEDILPATNATALRCRVSTNGGVSYDSGASDYAFINEDVQAAGTASGNSAAQDYMEITRPATSNSAGIGGICVDMHVVNAANASARTKFHGTGGYYLSAPAQAAVRFFGQRLAAQDTDAIRFYFSAGNIASGRIRMYGVV
jgi:hypothetical protein